MNRITRIAALALTVAAAGSAFADDITIDTTPQTSLKTRAEVQGELAQFQQQRVNPWSSSYNVLAGFQSSRNRADVTAEVKAARASGELAAMGAEDSGSAYLAQLHGPASAATALTTLARR